MLMELDPARDLGVELWCRDFFLLARLTNGLLGASGMVAEAGLGMIGGL